MTEAEWRACSDPTPMLAYLRGKASKRKMRLFAVACCRRIRPLLSDKRHRDSVEAAERYADDQATPDELQSAGDAAVEATWALEDRWEAAWPAEPNCGVLPAAYAAEMTGCSNSAGHVWGEEDDGDGPWGAAVEAAAWGASAEVRGQEKGHQAGLLRCIFGDPFRPVTADPAWLTPTAVGLAEGVYQDRAFDRMPVLADAVQEAGCEDEDVLTHCRGDGPHVRGCWVVDLLLGKT